MRSQIITVSIIEHPIYDMHTIGKPCLISAMEIFTLIVRFAIAEVLILFIHLLEVLFWSLKLFRVLLHK